MERQQLKKQREWQGRNRLTETYPMHPWTKAGYIVAAVMVAFVLITAIISHWVLRGVYDSVPRAIAMAVTVMGIWLAARIAAIAKLRWLRWLGWLDAGIAGAAAMVWCWVSPWNWDDTYNVWLTHLTANLVTLTLPFGIGILVAALASTYYAHTDPRWLQMGTFGCVASCIVAGALLALWIYTTLKVLWVAMWVMVALAVICSILIAAGMGHKRGR